MMQIFGKGLFALVLTSGLVVSGCGSDSTSTTTTTGTDTTASDATGGDTTTDTTTADTAGADTGAADVAVDPCSKCADNQECKDDVCVDKVPPCGGPCAAGEICDAKADGGKGKCIKPTCELPKAEDFAANTNINKISALKLLTDKEGCDLDDDGVPNNVLGKIITLAATINDTISDSVKDGTIVILLAPNGLKTDGSEFTCDLLIGDVDPSTKDCDATKEGDCKYTVSTSSYDQLATAAKCPTLVTFDPVTVKDGKLAAGGDKQNFDLTLPIVGIELKLRISRAQLKGDQSDATAWKTTKNGMLCGVLSEDDLNAAIDAVPDSALASTGFDKATIKGLLPTILKSDIDTDGDGTNDAMSVALSLETFAASVTGFTAK